MIKKIKDLIYDIKWEVKYYSREYILHPYYDFKNGIKQLFLWSKIIWQDRDWDWVYILIMLKFKLEKTRKCLLNGLSVDAEDRAWEIEKCIYFLDRLIEDNYHEEFESFQEVEEAMERDTKFLFEIMRKNIRKWWD